MPLSDFQLELQRPVIRRLKIAKQINAVVLIVACAALPFLLEAVSPGSVNFVAFATGSVNATSADMGGYLGSVFLASGLIPLLLSLPLVFAKFLVVRKNSIWKIGFWVGDASSILVYAFWYSIAAFGLFLLVRHGGWNSAASEASNIFAEIFVIGVITTLLRVPAIEEDTNKAFLTKTEVKQLERSGTLNASFVKTVDAVLDSGRYHDDLAYFYPNEITSHSHLSALRRKSIGRMLQLRSSKKRKLRTALQLVERGESASLSAPATRNSILINAAPEGWGSAFFVAALGRCDLSVLGEELISGLLCICSGAQAASRFIQQAAVTSLGNLYFGSGNRNISHRLLQMWKMHEISTVRNHLRASINAIGDATTIAYFADISNPSAISSTVAAKAYYSSRGFSAKVLASVDFAEAQKAYQMSPECGEMALLRCCVIANRNAASHLSGEGAALKGEIIANFIDFACSNILGDPLVDHARKTLCLEVLHRFAQHHTASLTKGARERCWQSLCEENFESLFKNVRSAALGVLQATRYPHIYCFKLFGDDAVERFASFGNFSARSVQDVLHSFLPNDLVCALNETAINVDEDNFEDRHGGMSPAEDPTLLLYAHTAKKNAVKPKAETVQMLLNSEDRMKRFVALLIVGRFDMEKMKKEILPDVAEREMISTVRDFAILVLKMGDNPRYACCAGVSDAEDIREKLCANELERLEARMRMVSNNLNNAE